MALETPIITTNSGGNPETVVNEQSGILVNYNDKEVLKNSINRVLGSRELQDKFVRNGIIELSKFDESKMLDELTRFLIN